jgi:hypothetical protein
MTDLGEIRYKRPVHSAGFRQYGPEKDDILKVNVVVSCVFVLRCVWPARRGTKGRVVS